MFYRAKTKCKMKVILKVILKHSPFFMYVKRKNNK